MIWQLSEIMWKWIKEAIKSCQMQYFEADFPNDFFRKSASKSWNQEQSWKLSLVKLKMNQRSYNNLPNSGFWGWLSLKSQPQNPEFRILKTLTHVTVEMTPISYKLLLQSLPVYEWDDDILHINTGMEFSTGSQECRQCLQVELIRKYLYKTTKMIYIGPASTGKEWL